MLSVYLNRKYSYVKTIRLCANILIKNVFTSDTKYTPGISMKVARKTGPYVLLVLEQFPSDYDESPLKPRRSYLSIEFPQGEETLCFLLSYASFKSNLY